MDEYIEKLAIDAEYDCWLVLGYDEELLWQCALGETPETDEIE